MIRYGMIYLLHFKIHIIWYGKYSLFLQNTKKCLRLHLHSYLQIAMTNVLCDQQKFHWNMVWCTYHTVWYGMVYLLYELNHTSPFLQLGLFGFSVMDLVTLFSFVMGSSRSIFGLTITFDCPLWCNGFELAWSLCSVGMGKFFDPQDYFG